MAFMMRSLTGDWKFWIYFDVDMKLQYIEEFYEKIAEFESTSAIVKSITCDQGYIHQMFSPICFTNFFQQIFLSLSS